MGCWAAGAASRNHEPFSSLSLILLALRVPRTYFPAEAALELWGITCGKMGEGGRATTIADGGREGGRDLSSLQSLLSSLRYHGRRRRRQRAENEFGVWRRREKESERDQRRQGGAELGSRAPAFINKSKKKCCNF